MGYISKEVRGVRNFTDLYSCAGILIPARLVFNQSGPALVRISAVSNSIHDRHACGLSGG